MAIQNNKAGKIKARVGTSKSNIGNQCGGVTTISLFVGLVLATSL
jgi:exosortase/archaeosortase